jgi:putative Mg2+ transporter-C (MgtC) family protein
MKSILLLNKNSDMFVKQGRMVMDNMISQIGEALIPIFGSFDPVLTGRLLLVLVLCGAIGLERSGHERASGFRPHILVGLGACLMTMAGAYALPEYIATRDPMRVASYVVSGIGFLGAGAILRHGTMVRGLTTAASIWSAAGLGIAVGVGLGWLALMTTFLILFTLIVLESLETRIGRRGRTNELRIHLTDSKRAVSKALTALDRLGIQIRSGTLLPGAGETSVLRVKLNQPIQAENVPLLVKQLLVLKSVERVDAKDVAISVAKPKLISEDPIVETATTSLSPFEDQTLLQDLNEPDEDVTKST